MYYGMNHGQGRAARPKDVIRTGPVPGRPWGARASEAPDRHPALRTCLERRRSTGPKDVQLTPLLGGRAWGVLLGWAWWTSAGRPAYSASCLHKGARSVALYYTEL